METTNFGLKLYCRIYINLVVTLCIIFLIPNKLLPNKTTGIIKDDFLINDDTTGTSSQKSPHVSANSSNEFIICWEDWRSGFGEIFLQRFDSLGNKVDTNLAILSKFYSLPNTILFDNNAFMVFCYKNDKMYYQSFNSANIAISPLNNIADTLYGNQINLKAARDKNGNYAAVWEDTRLSNENIYLQLWDSTNTKIGNNIRVDIDSDSTRHNFLPNLTYSENGDFIVIWLSYDFNSDNIYLQYQQFNRNGNFINNNQNIFSIYDINHSSPSLAINKLGQCMIVYTAGLYDIYAQCFDINGIIIFPEVKINSIPGDNFNPKITLLNQTNFLVGWENMGFQQGDIYCQQVTSSGNLIGTNIKVNGDSGSWEHSELSISKNMNDGCILTWYDDRNSENNIYSQKIDSTQNFIGTNQKVNDDVGANSQQNPTIAMNENGEIVFAWQDGRNRQTATDIYIQKVNENGQTIGNNFKANDDSSMSFSQIFPEISIDSVGNFACVWQDKRNYDNNIYGQWYNQQCNMLGNNVLISDNTTWTTNYYPRIEMNLLGQSVITWFTLGSGYYRIYDNLGYPISSQLSTFSGMYPDAGVCSDGRFAITWMSNSDIYMQRYSANGNTIGGTFGLIDDITSSSQYASRNAMNSNGNAIAVWIDERNGYQEVWAQYYDINGIIIGNNFKVSNQSNSGVPYTPKVSINENGESIVVWSNALQNYRYAIYGQKIDSLGNLIGTNILLIDTVGNNYLNRPYVACNNQQIAITWQDNRRRKGLDIYAKIFTWDWEGIVNSSHANNRFPSDFELKNNYPNPFNSHTNINFILAKPSSISLIVYNLLGKKIKTIISGNVQSGKHSVNWSGLNDANEVVSSGVYFYRLEVPMNGQSKTKKMLLIK